MSATLGGLLKDYRVQKNISQLEISFAVGWRESSRLSRIEQGKVGRPKRDLLDGIINAMRLSEEEQNRLLLAGGYVPTLVEITKARKKIQADLHSWHYPVMVYDFTWRIVYVNDPFLKAFNYKIVFGKLSVKETPRVFEFFFHRKYIDYSQLKPEETRAAKKFLLGVLAQFQNAQVSRTHDEWYKVLIRKMMSNEQFRTLWEEVGKSEQVSQSDEPKSEFIIHPDTGVKRLRFYSFEKSLVHDPRFVIKYYVPADLESYSYFKKE